MNIKTSKNINNLRWYLCLIVVIGHFFKIFYLVFDNDFINWSGFLAVCSFMFLSGYVNHNSILRHKNRYSFLVSRAKRILIPFYIAFFFSILILFVFSVEFKQEYFLNLFMLHHLFGFLTISSNAPLWTIPYEVLLYIVFALSFNNKYAKCVAIIFAFGFFAYLNNPYYLIFYILFSIGSLLSHYKVELDFIYIPFFIKNNWTYELYLFHYPVFLVILRLIS
jgi:peptidoglycan/LPS O-acetylase OafA/YrhL